MLSLRCPCRQGCVGARAEQAVQQVPRGVLVPHNSRPPLGTHPSGGGGGGGGPAQQAQPGGPGWVGAHQEDWLHGGAGQGGGAHQQVADLPGAGGLVSLQAEPRLVGQRGRRLGSVLSSKQADIFA